MAAAFGTGVGSVHTSEVSGRDCTTRRVRELKPPHGFVIVLWKPDRVKTVKEGPARDTHG